MSRSLGRLGEINFICEEIVVFNRLSIATLLMLLALPVAGSGQIVGDDVTSNLQASWKTAKAGAMALRVPGNMVSAAVADYNSRHGDSINRSFSGPTITEEPAELTLGQQVKVQAIETVFDQLNTALALYLEALKASNGQSTDLSSLVSLLGNISSPV